MNILKKLAAVMIAAAISVSSAGCADTTVSEGVTSADTTTSVSTSSQSDAPEESVPIIVEDITAEAPVTETIPTTSQTTAEEAPETSQATEAATTPAATTVNTTTATTTAAPDEVDIPEEKPADKAIVVSCNISNTWQEDGMECSQIEVALKNNTGSDTASWSIKLDLGQQAEIMQSWNVNISANGNTITASNVDYNGTISAGGETTFGFIVKTPKAVSSVKVNGSPVSGTSQPKPQTTTAATTSSSPKPQTPSVQETNRAGLVSVHGQLSVKGTDLVDKNGEPVQLRGVSTHGIQWFPAFANKDLFRYLRDEWNINVIRLAMYTGAGDGYTDGTKAGIEQTVQNAVDAAIELDMYVIVDWHILQDQSPQVRKADALRFFGYMSEKYANYPNIIYEICNEPNGYASWSGDIKPYAEEVIPVIRANDPDSVVIVGTPTCLGSMKNI